MKYQHNTCIGDRTDRNKPERTIRGRDYREKPSASEIFKDHTTKNASNKGPTTSKTGSRVSKTKLQQSDPTNARFQFTAPNLEETRLPTF